MTFSWKFDRGYPEQFNLPYPQPATELDEPFDMPIAHPYLGYKYSILMHELTNLLFYGDTEELLASSNGVKWLETVDDVTAFTAWIGVVRRSHLIDTLPEGSVERECIVSYCTQYDITTKADKAERGAYKLRIATLRALER